jgi:hypothetical protein
MDSKIYISKKGFLLYRLQWNNQRSWEGTTLRDATANRQPGQARRRLMSREMRAGRFDYARWFPAGIRFRKTMRNCKAGRFASITESGSCNNGRRS